MDCGEGAEEGRRVRVVGKEAVWKVERGRRRWPVWDLGSVFFFGAVSIGVFFFGHCEGWKKGERWQGQRGERVEDELTFRIELEDMDIRICVRNDEVEIFAVGEEIAG